MNNKDRNLIKKKIVQCLTEDFKGNQAIFNIEGWQVFNGTDLTMVMDAVAKGLEMAKHEINKRSKSTNMEVKNEYGLHACPFCCSSKLRIHKDTSKDGTITWHKILHNPESECGVSMLNSDRTKLIERWNNPIKK